MYIIIVDQFSLFTVYRSRDPETGVPILVLGVPILVYGSTLLTVALYFMYIIIFFQFSFFTVSRYRDPETGVPILVYGNVRMCADLGCASVRPS